MHAVQGTPININGRTGGTPGPATTTATRVPMPVPAGRQKLSNPSGGGQVIAPSTTFARYLRVSCVDATNDLKVSFLDGNTVTIVHGTSQEFGGTIQWIVVQASAGTAQWEAHAVVAA